MSTIFSGPMFEYDSEHFRSEFKKTGAHYNIYCIQSGSIEALRNIFPDGKANCFNLCLFSTSGIHGTYTTIEDIEDSLLKYGSWVPSDDDWPEDYHRSQLTVLVIQPRIVCLRYGNIDVALDDIPFLKTLRQTSWQEFQKIGNVSH